MKRKGNLVAEITNVDNLYLAYWKAKRGKSNRPEVLAFSQDLSRNIAVLQSDIKEGNLNFGNYHYFTIYDPKERLICASSFRERVLQHALMNVCHDYFDCYQIHDSYACRIGKGTYAALEKAKSFAATYRYFAKLDVRKFFETIDHNTVKRQLSHLFKDKQLLLIFFEIIDSYENKPKKGVPIGNLSSQYFANHFLGEADHFVKKQVRVKAYLRYMDDMVLWSNDLEELKKSVRRFRAFMESHLHCELKPNVINHIDKGLPFLGYVVYPQKMTLAKRSRKRFRRKYKELNYLLKEGQIDETDYHKRILPTIAFTQKADAYLFRKKVMAQDREKCLQQSFI